MSESLCKKAGTSYYEMSKVIDDTVQSEKGLLPNVDFIRPAFITRWGYH
ncbi:MAG: hypothetical protein R2827_12040 [Bdellovibrionales bacterium]